MENAKGKTLLISLMEGYLESSNNNQEKKEEITPKYLAILKMLKKWNKRIQNQPQPDRYQNIVSLDWNALDKVLYWRLLSHITLLFLF
jgi:hypothetical protein